MSDRPWGYGVTKNTVGVNGIDPVRQGFISPPQILGTLKAIVSATYRRSFFAISLANRANAIRPYGILRHRSLGVIFSCSTKSTSQSFIKYVARQSSSLYVTIESRNSRSPLDNHCAYQ